MTRCWPTRSPACCPSWSARADSCRTSRHEPRRHRLREAYLTEFTDLAGLAELVETAKLACRVARIARALVWDRALRPGGDTGFEIDESWLRAPLESLTPLLRS